MNDSPEPIYNFVKGQGWIVGEPWYECITASKRKVRVEFRMPKLRERHGSVYVPDYTHNNPLWDFVKNDFNKEEVLKEVRTRYVSDLSVCTRGDLNYYARNPHYKNYTVISIR